MIVSARAVKASAMRNESDPSDLELFARRAQEERAAAAEAADSRAAQSHTELAEHFEQMARGEVEPARDEPATAPGASPVLPSDFRILP
jgi:hypothetical protein